MLKYGGDPLESLSDPRGEISWIEFKEAFAKVYYPEDVQIRKHQELTHLKHRGHLVTAYAREFAKEVASSGTRRRRKLTYYGKRGRKLRNKTTTYCGKRGRKLRNKTTTYCGKRGRKLRNKTTTYCGKRGRKLRNKTTTYCGKRGRKLRNKERTYSST
ncbi:hypothetical protein SDJN03_07012, partial [Cucurbita argyrosperma subsp. sororia]